MGGSQAHGRPHPPAPAAAAPVTSTPAATAARRCTVRRRRRVAGRDRPATAAGRRHACRHACAQRRPAVGAVAAGSAPEDGEGVGGGELLHPPGTPPSLMPRLRTPRPGAATGVAVAASAPPTATTAGPRPATPARVAVPPTASSVAPPCWRQAVWCRPRGRRWGRRQGRIAPPRRATPPCRRRCHRLRLRPTPHWRPPWATPRQPAPPPPTCPAAAWSGAPAGGDRTPPPSNTRSLPPQPPPTPTRRPDAAGPPAAAGATPAGATTEPRPAGGVTTAASARHAASPAAQGWR